MLTPAHFGLPPKFDQWRPKQLEAINQILESDKRFQILCAPTGFGKSLVYMAAAHMAAKRTCVLTSTKGLQDQLQRDFDAISADIRGQTNYRCPIASTLNLPIYTSVADAPCKGGMECRLKDDNRCDYYRLYRIAQSSPIVVTNYACWLYDSIRKSKLDEKKKFNILILDEAHDAPEQVAGFLGTELSRKDCLLLGIDWPDPTKINFNQWKAWAAEWWAKLDGRSRDDSIDHDRRAKCRKMARKMYTIASMSQEEDWVIDPKASHKGGESNPLLVRFDPLWVSPYCESVLFREVERVVLVSATVRTKTAQLLGVSPQECQLVEYPSNFPVERRPVIHVSTVQMNFRTEQDDWKVSQWLNQIDRIIEKRLDRKGIIHTVSFKRAQLIYENSRHSSKMLIHDSQSARLVIERFKKSSEPCVLISPSVSTGYDFPYQECQYQIITKLPFPSTQDKITKARMERDKDWGNYIAMQQLVQSVGRGMRAKDDQCETFVVDDNIEWFLPRNRKFAPKWFLDSVRSEEYVTEPLPKL